MPIHLPAVSRREFLFTVGAGLVSCSSNAFGREIEGDLVYLSVPEGAADAPFIPIDSEIKESIRKKQEELAKARQAQAMEKLKQVKNVDLPSPESGGDDVIIIFNKNSGAV